MRPCCMLLIVPSPVEVSDVWPDGVQVACNEVGKVGLPHLSRQLPRQQPWKLIVEAVGATISADPKSRCGTGWAGKSMWR